MNREKEENGLPCLNDLNENGRSYREKIIWRNANENKKIQQPKKKKKKAEEAKKGW